MHKNNNIVRLTIYSWYHYQLKYLQESRYPMLFLQPVTFQTTSS